MGYSAVPLLAEGPAMPSDAGRTLVLGEAVIDLISEAHDPREPRDSVFRPHRGGTAVNVAVGARRMGAGVSLMTAAGADIWGDWLRRGIMAETISGEFFQLLPGGLTPVSVVTVDSDGEATIAMYGDDMGRLFVGLDSVLPKALADVNALFFTSNTLTGPVERALTVSALRDATAKDALVIFDANLRLARWSDAADAVARCMDVLGGVSILKCNLEDARILSGRSTVETASRALNGHGPEFVVVTLGAEGAYIRGAKGQSAHFPARPALPRCALGAGDAVSASLIAHLGEGRTRWEALSAGVREGMVLAARAIEEWGAFATQAG